MAKNPKPNRPKKHAPLSTSDWLEKKCEIRPQQLKRLGKLIKATVTPPDQPIAEQVSHAIGEEGPEQLCRLLESGADPNVRDRNGQPAIIQAIEVGRPAALRALLAAGADPHARDTDGFTAWEHANASGHPSFDTQSSREIAQILREAGAEAELPMPLQLVRAIERSDIKEAKRLLKAGADVNAPTLWGRRPLATAAEYGRADLVQILLDAGADIEGRGWRGRTPLMAAAAAGQEAAARLLVERGADVLATNPSEGAIRPERTTAYDYARNEYHSDLAEYLQKVMKQRRDKLRDRTPKPQRLADRSGVEKSGGDYLMILVRAKLPDAMKKMAFVTGIDNWKYSKAEVRVKLRRTSFAMLQCRGQPWTIATGITPMSQQQMSEIAEELSMTLETRVICVVAQGGEVSTSVYDDGDLAKGSAARSSDPWHDLDALLQSEQAYLPAIAGPCGKSGQVFALTLPASIKQDDLVGLRYIIAP